MSYKEKNYKPKYKMLTFLLVFTFIFSVFTFFSYPVKALTMDSTQFKIEDEDIGLIPADQTETPDNLYTLLNPQDLLKFQRQGYVVKTNNATGLQFSITDTSISFENIEAGRFSSQGMGLRVDLDNLGYQVFTYQEIPLRSESGGTIVGTLCDNNSRPCSFEVSAPWINPDNIGLGYNINNSNIARDFKETNYFRPFSTSIAAKPNFFIRKRFGGPSQARITVKMATKGESQKYQGEIVLMALPKF